MPKLRVLGTKQIILILESFGFAVSGQRGSHIKLSRVTDIQKQILTIPNYKELPKGTLKAIFNQASKFISQDELKEHFYTD